MNKNKGFTLIELMLSAVILTIIISVVYACFRGALSAHKRTEAKIELYQNARIALEQISMDVRSTFADSQFIGFDRTSGDNDTDVLDFVTVKGGFSEGDSVDYYDLYEVGYFIDSDASTLEEGLQRRVQKIPDNDVQTGGIVSELAPMVKSLDLKYKDKSQWKSTWGIDESRKIPLGEIGNLPLAVEVSLTVGDASENTLTFSTVIPVFCSNLMAEH